MKVRLRHALSNLKLKVSTKRFELKRFDKTENFGKDLN